MMFRFIRTTVFNTFCLLNSAQKDRISPLLAVLVLKDTRVYFYIFDGSNVASYVEVPVDQSFYLTTTLDILDVHQNNGHVQLGGDFDNVWLRCQSNFVENVVFLDDIFNHT